MTPADRPVRPGVEAGTGLVVAAWAGLGAVLAACAPRPVLLVVLLPVQVLLATSWLAALGTPARRTGLLIAGGAALAADLLLAVRADPGVGALAGVVGLAVVAAVMGQLGRRERSRVTDVLAAQCSAAVLAVAPSPLLALAALHHGGRAVGAVLVVVGVSLVGYALHRRLAATGHRRGALVLLLPFAAVGPVAYLVGRLVLG